MPLAQTYTRLPDQWAAEAHTMRGPRESAQSPIGPIYTPIWRLSQRLGWVIRTCPCVCKSEAEVCRRLGASIRIRHYMIREGAGVVSDDGQSVTHDRVTRSPEGLRGPLTGAHKRARYLLQGEPKRGNPRLRMAQRLRSIGAERALGRAVAVRALLFQTVNDDPLNFGTCACRSQRRVHTSERHAVHRVPLSVL